MEGHAISICWSDLCCSSVRSGLILTYQWRNIPWCASNFNFNSMLVITLISCNLPIHIRSKKSFSKQNETKKMTERHLQVIWKASWMIWMLEWATTATYTWLVHSIKPWDPWTRRTRLLFPSKKIISVDFVLSIHTSSILRTNYKSIVLGLGREYRQAKTKHE